MFSRPFSRVVPAIIILISAALQAHGSDQQKAEKRLRRISAMATVGLARGIVNQTMADAVHAQRIELMRQRHAMNLSYGSLFLAHQLTEAGARMLDIAVELESGKEIIQIANEHHANWKLIADAAKQLSEKIDDNIYEHYLHLKADEVAAAADKYDSVKDIVRDDLQVTAEELASAQGDYSLWKNRALPNGGGRLDSMSERDASQTAEIYKGGERPHSGP
jgi:hypothetical protein